MQATLLSFAPGRLRAPTDASKAYLTRRCARVSTSQHHRLRQPFAHSVCIRPVHLSKTCFRPFKPVAAQLVSDTETAQNCLEATVKATEHLLKRKAIDSSILLQGFSWTSCDQQSWYKQLQEKVDVIKEQGFTHIWLPPPSQSVSPQGYLPAQLYDLTSRYGTKEELQSLTWTLNHAGIRPIADVVINHRCGDIQSETGVWNLFGDSVPHRGRPINWGTWAVCQDDVDFAGTGNPKQGASYSPAPDLDHSNEVVKESLKEWLSWLRHEIGFMGWRFDFAKGYLPKWVQEYTNASIPEEAMHLAEFWVDMRWCGSSMDYDQDAPRQVLCDWISASGAVAAAFDFPTKGILQEATKWNQYDRLRDRDGRAPGLLGWWPQRACTFVDNHDTGSTQRHWPFPDYHIGVGYAYILTHPGVPCVAWEHMWDPHNGGVISKLIALRKRQDLHAGSKLDILCAERNMYVAKIDDRVVVKLGPQTEMGCLLPSADDGWHMCVTGHDFAVWEKTGAPVRGPL